MTSPKTAIHLLLFATLLAAFGGAHAQGASSSVRVVVTDSSGHAIANADVAVLQGLNARVTSGVTDSAGAHTLVLPAHGEYQLVARRLGYERSSQFFTAAGGTVVLRVVLTQVPASIAGVTVTANEDRKRHDYHVGAEEIAASERPILDGLDVLRKMRPQMIDSRVIGGFRNCNPSNVFVNGQRITLAPVNERLQMEQRQLRIAHQNMLPVSAGKSVTPQGPTGIAGVPLNYLSVLASIKPEHIEEITYADCNDTTVALAHGLNAVYVALKAGVGYRPGIGSYVEETVAPIMGNRLRIVGVYDESTGGPIRGAEIVDPKSGMHCLTSETGTASLAFLPDGDFTLVVRKPGYAEQRLAVQISADHLTPITVVMSAVRRE